MSQVKILQRKMKTPISFVADAFSFFTGFLFINAGQVHMMLLGFFPSLQPGTLDFLIRSFGGLALSILGHWATRRVDAAHARRKARRRALNGVTRVKPITKDTAGVSIPQHKKESHGTR